MIICWKDGIQEARVLGNRQFGSLTLPNRKAIEEADPEYMTEIFRFHGPKREEGIYRLRSASGHLRRNATSQNGEYVLELTFVTLEEGLKLYELVSAGKIWPDVSFGGEQVPPPARHLKDLWHEAFGIVRREIAKRYHQVVT